MRPLVFLLLMPGALAAQSPRLLRLGPANGGISHDFVVVTSVRELADGRVLVTDPQDAGLLVADMVRDSTAVVGRKGRGPGEYQLPGHVFGMASDSSFVADVLRRRWLLLAGASIVRTVPPDDAALRAANELVLGVDVRGHVLTMRAPTFDGLRRVTKRDSSLVLFVHRATGRVDTVAKTRRQPGEEVREVDSSGRAIRTGRLSSDYLAGEEGVRLFPDGWLAVARLDPLRVDWRQPDGTWVRGARLAVPLVTYTSRERDALARRWRVGASPAQQPVPPVDRAATLPPFEHGSFSLLSATDGRLLILRTPSAELAGTRYLVVNRRGELDGELALAAAERIVGFGKSSVFVVVTDADDIQHLRRHAWPPR